MLVGVGEGVAVGAAVGAGVGGVAAVGSGVDVAIGAGVSVGVGCGVVATNAGWPPVAVAVGAVAVVGGGASSEQPAIPSNASVRMNAMPRAMLLFNIRVISAVTRFPCILSVAYCTL